MMTMNQAELSAKIKRLEFLEKEFDVVVDKNRSLVLQNHISIDKITDLQAQLSSKSHAINELTITANQRFQRIEVLEQECEELKTSVNNFTEMYQEKCDELSSLRAENERLKENYEGLKGHCKVLTEINVANESFDNSKLFRERHGIKEGDSFCEWFLNHKTKEFKSELDSSRKRCEDLEAILDNNGLSWTYKKLSQ